MRQIILLIALPFFISQSSAQGIYFETGNWKSIVEKANREHKLIYLDVYTTWCGPCKKLASEIFPLKEVGDKYNPFFVSYRTDAEKGEGIGISKKYLVHGYPTHLFINPQTEEVVCRGMGYSPEPRVFNHEAEIALTEFKDPMTWLKYEVQFNAGRKDTGFLKAFLAKADRLGKPNDQIMEAYIIAIGTDKLSDDDLKLIVHYVPGINNSSVAYLSKNEQRLNALYPTQPNFFHNMTKQWIYKTFERAKDTRNANLLAQIANGIQKYDPENEVDYYDYKTKFYAEIGDSVNELNAGQEEANFLSDKGIDFFTAKDILFTEENTLAIRSQLLAAKVPAEKMDTLMKINREQLASHTPSFSAAEKLNNIAWKAFEQHGKDTVLIGRALLWAYLATKLVADKPALWSLYADTHAHLLYISGRKEEAITLEQSAANVAKSAATEDAASLEETVSKMKRGEL